MTESNTLSKASPLLIEQFELGPMANYIYFIGDKETKEIVVVDPAWDVDFIRDKAKEAGLTIKGDLITHGHPDNTNGINKLLETHDIPVYVSKAEASFYKPIGENILEVDATFNLDIGNVHIDFLHTPGHTPGSQCFLVHGNLVAGDTLFLDGCGRCDLPGGDVETMFDTIHHKLMKLPDHTMIFPGHNYHHLHCDELCNQKKTNPYMQMDNLHSFINRRLPR
jgi:glyoxylase-like metal-dependent hydrolase (beta-lactamase superfamily II)